METTMIWPSAAFKEEPAYQPGIPYRSLLGTVLIALLLFWGIGSILQRLQPTAAVADIGVLSLVSLALLSLFVFTALSYLLQGLLWPVFRDYRKYHFHKNFKTLQPWQKISFYMSAFFLLLYAFVCCLLAVL